MPVMAIQNILNTIGISSPWKSPWRRTRNAPTPLPLYSPIAGSNPGRRHHNNEPGDHRNDGLHRAQRQGDDAHNFLIPSTRQSPPSSPRRPRTGLPSLSRFLSDFTLGFADGLTVPFALTAGLSSLGQTDTVIYAGLAEICAGSLSMGIGGYLSARGEYAEAAREMRRADEDRASRFAVSNYNNDEVGAESTFSDNSTALNSAEEGDSAKDPDVDVAVAGAAAAAAATKVAGPDLLLQASPTAKAANEKHRSPFPEARGLSPAAGAHLALLDLPPNLMDRVVAHILGRPDVDKALEMQEAAARGASEEDGGAPSEKGQMMCSPVLSGLSVAVGYLVGGALPLFPYFLVSHVGDGLKWSFAVCLLALFVFGFAKDFVLNWRANASSSGVAPRDGRWEEEEGAWGEKKRGSNVPWQAIGHSAWEGTELVLLGGAAALVAVLCVRVFEGMNIAGEPKSP